MTGHEQPVRQLLRAGVWHQLVPQLLRPAGQQKKLQF